MQQFFKEHGRRSGNDLIRIIRTLPTDSGKKNRTPRSLKELLLDQFLGGRSSRYSIMGDRKDLAIWQSVIHILTIALAFVYNFKCYAGYGFI
jgi:hypothetical protein